VPRDAGSVVPVPDPIRRRFAVTLAAAQHGEDRSVNDGNREGLADLRMQTRMALC